MRSTTPACFESVKALGQKICRDARRLRTQVAFEDFGTERAEPIGSVVEPVDEGPHGAALVQQEPRDMKTGRALTAAGGASDKNGLDSHDVVLPLRPSR